MEYTLERLQDILDYPMEDMIYIDTVMIPVLTELNAKGYVTSTCCGGHPDNQGDDWSIYISFTEAIFFPIDAPCFDCIKAYEEEENRIKVKPNYYSRRSRSYIKVDDNILIRGLRWTKNFNGQTYSYEEMHKMILEWAQSLPPRNRKWKSHYSLSGIRSDESSKSFHNDYKCIEDVEKVIISQTNNPRYKYDYYMVSEMFEKDYDDTFKAPDYMYKLNNIKVIITYGPGHIAENEDSARQILEALYDTITDWSYYFLEEGIEKEIIIKKEPFVTYEIKRNYLSYGIIKKATVREGLAMYVGGVNGNKIAKILNLMKLYFGLDARLYIVDESENEAEKLTRLY